METADIPDTWSEVKCDTDSGYEGVWAHTDEPVMIHAQTDSSSPGEPITIVAEQHVSDDEYSTDITIAADDTQTVRGTESRIVELMDEIDGGDHVLRLLGTEEYREFVQFFCINDSELPGSMTADELIRALDQDAFEIDGDATFDLDDADIVVDVFPRLPNEALTGADDDG